MSVALVTQHSKRMRIIYCDLFVRLYHIFQHYLINDTILGKKLLQIKRVLVVYTNFV